MMNKKSVLPDRNNRRRLHPCKPSSYAIMLAVLTMVFPVYAENLQSITLKKTTNKLESTIKTISDQTGYDFIYQTDYARAISVKPRHSYYSNIEAALTDILKGTPIKYKIESRTVILERVPVSLIPKKEVRESQQEWIASGVITDAKGQPLASVSVKEKGTSRATLSNADGQFSLVVDKADAVLQFTSVGYLTQEHPFQSGSINVVLAEDLAQLEEVVVVGYGTQKRVNLTGSVATIDGSELENRPVVNATQSLQGVMPGLNASVNGNTKPGQSFKLNVRGVGNLSNSDAPYVLVDGMEMSLDDVNPNDIESISVLKDASASAIYGSRAAYGVILVTTKKGVSGKKQIHVTTNTGLTSPVKLPDMVNSVDFANFFNAATFNALGTKQYSEEKIALLQQYIDNPHSVSIFPEVNSNNYASWENSANGVANTNWFNLHYKPYALRQNYNINLSGGNDGTQFYVSGGMFDEDGSLRYADIKYKRYNFNVSVNSQLADFIKLKANVKYTHAQNHSPLAGFEGMFFHNLARMRPNVSPYDFYGNWTEQSMVPYLQSGSQDKGTNGTLALLGGVEISPLRNWKIFADLNMRKINGEGSVLKLPGTIYGIDGTPILVNRSEYNIPLTGSFSRDMNENIYLTPNIYTNYNIQAGNHQIDVTAGFQQEYFQAKGLLASATELISFERPGTDLATGTKSSRENRSHWATRGVFARVNYNFNNKYLLELNGRYDGSSRFASSQRWGFFPSISAAYNVSEEYFIKENADWLNQWKFRGSYGVLGNQAGANMYAYLENMNIVVPGLGTGGRYYFANGRESYIQSPGAFNPFITWEKVKSLNIATDFTLLNHRLTGTVEWYQRNTLDMLGPSRDVADMYGAVPPQSNNADLRTRGWEVSFKWRDRINEDWAYDLGLMLTDYRSIVTKYQNPTKFNPSEAWYEGKEVGEIWGYTANQLIKTEAEANEYNKLDRSFLSARDWVPGDVKYLDINNDEKINNGANRIGDMGDLSIVGNSAPRYNYSFSGGVSWKNLSMNMLWQGIGKMDFMPAAADAYFWGSGALAQVTVFTPHMDYFSETNPDAYYPNPYASPVGAINSYINKTQLPSSRYIQNASFLRLKNLTLQYALPQEWINRFKLSRFSVFASGENLLTFTKLADMFDPETITGGSGTGKIYPLSKVYSFGLNVNF